MEAVSTCNSQNDNSTFDETNELYTRLSGLTECICTDNFDQIQSQIPPLVEVLDQPKDFEELSKMIEEKPVDFQEELDKLEGEFKIDLNGIDAFKNPNDKIKFLDEKIILINKNREELEKKIKQIGNGVNENETGNSLLQQKLVKLNELEKKINKSYGDIDVSKKQMEFLQKEFCTQYTEMLNERRKLSKDCLIQEVKLSKLAGGIESLEKLASRDHCPNQAHTTPSKSHGKVAKQWSTVQNSPENDDECSKELDINVCEFKQVNKELNEKLNNLETDLKEICAPIDYLTLYSDFKYDEKTITVKSQIEDCEVSINKTLQSMNRDLSNLHGSSLRRDNLKSIVDEEYCNSIQYQVSSHIESLNDTDSLINAPLSEENTKVDKTKIVRKSSNISDKSWQSKASSRCSSVSRKRYKISDSDIQQVIKTIEKKSDILKLNKDNYSHLFANKEKSVEEYNIYMKTDLAGFKKHCDEKILHNITSIESIDYDLRHDAVDLDNDINDLANNLSTNSINKVKARLINMSSQVNNIFKHIEKKLELNEVTTKQLLALNLMDKNIVSILTDKILFCSQILCYNQNLLDNCTDSLSHKLENLEDQVSSAIEISVAGCDPSDAVKELKQLIDHLATNQSQIKERAYKFTDSFSEFKDSFSNLSEKFEAVSLSISQFKKFKTSDSRYTNLDDLRKQIKAEIEIQKLRFELEDQDYDQTFNRFQSLDNELKEMIYSITFDQDSIDSKSKSNDQILNENTTQLRNLDEVKKYSKGLNSKITILDKEIKTYNDMLTDCLDLYKSLYVKAQSASVIKEKMKDIIEEYTHKNYEIEEMKQTIYNDIEAINKMTIKEIHYKGVNIIVRKNDLVLEKTNAIVNQTNERLDHSSGMDKIITEAGGQEINEECRKYIFTYKKLGTGNAIATKAGNLPCEYVIHVVGPSYNKSLPDNTLAITQMKMAIENILKIVFEKGIVSVSIPPISTDALGFPVTKAATTIIGTLINYIDANPNNLKGKTIVLCSLEEQAIEAFKNALKDFDIKTEETSNFESYCDKSLFLEESKILEIFEYAGESKSNTTKCAQCGMKIRNKTHHKNGLHLDQCYDCYIASKRKKKDDRNETVDDASKSGKSRNKIINVKALASHSLEKYKKSPTIKQLGKSFR